MSGACYHHTVQWPAFAPALPGLVGVPYSVLVAAAAGTVFRIHIGKAFFIALYRAMRRRISGYDVLSGVCLVVFLYTPYANNIF